VRKTIAILLTILMLFTLFQGALRENVVKADDQPIWPMLQYNAQRTGQCPYDTSKNIGVLKWKVMIRTGFFTNFLSSPHAAIGFNGVVYLGGLYDDYLYALNPDGTIKWKFYLEGGVAESPAIASDGTIYVGTLILDYLYAITPDGVLKWKYRFSDCIESSPLISSDGTVYIGSKDGYLYAFNPDGTIKWKFKTDNEIRASATIAPSGTIYVSSSGNYLYAINPDGTLK